MEEKSKNIEDGKYLALALELIQWKVLKLSKSFFLTHWYLLLLDLSSLSCSKLTFEFAKF